MKTHQLGFLLCVISIICVVHAGTRRVPQQCSTIQSAIDSSMVGDTVLISAGSYSENPYIAKAIVIIGASRESVTIWSPSTFGYTVLIESPDGVVLSSMRVLGSGPALFANGGTAVGISSSQHVMLVNVDMLGGPGGNGICALQFHSPATGGGNAISIANSTGITADNCSLYAGIGGMTNRQDPHCDGSIGNNGVSVQATNHSVLYIDNSRLTYPTTNDITSYLIFNNVQYVTSVSDQTVRRAAKDGFALKQNYPNRFNPSTTIGYILPERTHVVLAVYNTLGQQVASLVNATREAGYHDARLDAMGLASGVYFYRLSAGAYVETKKLFVVR